MINQKTLNSMNEKLNAAEYSQQIEELSDEQLHLLDELITTELQAVEQ